MANMRKIVVHSTSGLDRDISGLARSWMSEGVRFIVVVGRDASGLEEAIDWVCIGDGKDPYERLTASLGVEEGISDALNLAESISDEYGESISVVEF